MKSFYINADIESGVVRTKSGIGISFDKEQKSVTLIAYTDYEVEFSELEDYIETLKALAFALREDIQEAIEEKQDDSLPDIVGDDTDHVPYKPRLQLEVGKKYKNRLGGIITIISDDADPTYPFNGDNGKCYTRYGYELSDRESDNDLVEEVEG